MTLGPYDCRLLLTEESFHQSGAGNGYWASAMSFDHLWFDVVETLVGVPDHQAPAPVSPVITRLRNTPNPFNPRTMIRFDLASAAKVDLCVYDTSGRLVQVLLRQAWMPQGPGEKMWDGMDDTERPVAAGVYFYRLAVGGEVAVGRMALVR